MKKWIFSLISCLIYSNIHAQTDTDSVFLFKNSLTQIEWEVDFDMFLDNREFSNPYVRSESMLGAWGTPSIGYTFAPGHSVHGGIGLLQEFGFTHLVDDYVVMLFYKYQGERFNLQVGSFPRRDVLIGYDLALFADEVAYHLPNLMGVHWNYRGQYAKANLWLDWTGRQTETQRESFLLGSDTRWNYDALYAGYKGYIFHYAGTMSEAGQVGRVLDNGMLLVNAGLDLTHYTSLPFEQLYIEAGYLREFARIRQVTGWITPSGILATAYAEWRGLGIKNVTYKGAGQYEFYDINRYGHGGSDLYWGDPWFRNSFYNRTDAIMTFFETDKIHASFRWGFHFAKGELSHQQQFFVRINFGSQGGKLRPAKKPLIWEDFFQGN